MSGIWFNSEKWLDFNMFQSGHRRYGQRKGDGDYPIIENTEEDNWRFVESNNALEPRKPVIDGEPIYEDIPHGLHDANEIKWNDHDVRRYAYWSVFAGSLVTLTGITPHADEERWNWWRLWSSENLV